MINRALVGQLLLLLCSCFAISGCVTSSGNALVGIAFGDIYEWSGEEEVVRGVVNGLYEYNPDKTAEELKKYDDHLSTEIVSEYSQRYVVRVGVNRAPVLSVISPIVIGAEWIDYVILPSGWSHDLSEISKDPSVINVGDVVDVNVGMGRRYDYLIKRVRQCDAPPSDDENPDWNIGCKTYTGYNDRGYAGEYYTFRAF